MLGKSATHVLTSNLIVFPGGMTTCSSSGVRMSDESDLSDELVESWTRWGIGLSGSDWWSWRTRPLPLMLTTPSSSLAVAVIAFELDKRDGALRLSISMTHPIPSMSHPPAFPMPSTLRTARFPSVGSPQPCEVRRLGGGRSTGGAGGGLWRKSEVNHADWERGSVAGVGEGGPETLSGLAARGVVSWSPESWGWSAEPRARRLPSARQAVNEQ